MIVYVLKRGKNRLSKTVFVRSIRMPGIKRASDCKCPKCKYI